MRACIHTSMRNLNTNIDAFEYDQIAAFFMHSLFIAFLQDAERVGTLVLCWITRAASAKRTLQKW